MLASATRASPGSSSGRHGANACDVVQRVAADLELKSAIALGAVFRDATCHHLGRFLRDRAVEDKVVAIAPAQQHANRLTGCLAEDIPAGHVDGRLDIRVALQGRIHPPVQLGELPRIFAQQVRPELGDARPRRRA